jgi:WD40 repeat protein
LAGPVEQVRYAPNERYIAALTQDWQIGIWELPGGNLRHLLDVPPGLFADNAGFAFNADGSQFAFSAETRAILWDVITGRVVREWSLPPGLGDQLAFHSSGKLLSVRSETLGKILPPYGHVPWREHARVVRLRDLLGQRHEEPIREIRTFNRSVLQSLMARNASYFVLDGVGGPNGADRSIRAYDGPTGKELWAIKGVEVDHSGYLKAEPAGSLLALRPSAPGAKVVEMPSGPPHRGLPEHPSWWPTALGPAAEYRVRIGDPPRFGYQLRHGDSPTPVVILGLDIESRAAVVEFNSRGSQLVWGNVDGTVYVCDLRKVQTRLAELGFGW